jgi:cytochrome d ubiquinol oxidase subunit I
MEFDALLLSRIQFAWVIGWHILLPAFTVGLASFIAVLEGLYLFGGNEIYRRVSTFWIKIFSVSFGMGVVSGVVMPFQFGTNWSRFSDATANVLAPLFAYEGLTAFFLEAAFLGVLLFGRRLVPRPLYFFAALMVAFGTLLSSFWILSVNSWMQTPAGFEVVDGRFFPVDWWAIAFNPSFPYRLAHTVTGFYITTALVVAGIGTFLLRRPGSMGEAKVMLSMALWLLTILVPLQITIGDLHGVNTLHHQPAKLAAIEGLWETSKGVPATIFAIPNASQERNDFVLEVPKIGSLYLTHSLEGEVRGLKDFPRDERPPVAVVFFAFRVMVGCGVAMLGLVVISLWLRRRGRLFDTKWFGNLCMATSPLGFFAVIAGWTTTEVGRQPWTVYGLLQTGASVTPSLTAFDVALSLTAYIGAYLIMYPAGVFVMARMVGQGPEGALATDPVEAGRPERPVEQFAIGRRET